MIQTTDQNIDTQPRYAGFWIRTAATLIDWIIIIVITYPILYLTYGSSYWSYEVDQPFISGSVDFLATFVFPFFYSVLFWIYRAATPGKIILKLKILDAKSGQRLSPLQSVGRYIGYFVSAIPLALGFIWVAWDKNKQSWHDKLATTIVVHENRGSSDQMGA